LGKNKDLETNEEVGKRTYITMRIFMVLFGSLIVVTGSIIVYYSVQVSPIKPEILAGLFFAFLGCLMLFAGISKRTKVYKIPEGSGPSYTGD
jgi:putative Mn2+ efflux pump MntP